jgi:hypothetical protein
MGDGPRHASLDLSRRTWNTKAGALIFKASASTGRYDAAGDGSQRVATQCVRVPRLAVRERQRSDTAYAKIRGGQWHGADTLVVRPGPVGFRWRTRGVGFAKGLGE